MNQSILCTALANADFPAALAALSHDVVFHSPILATLGDEIRGQAVVGRILATAFAIVGLPRNVEEFRNPDGRYIITYDGAVDDHPIQFALHVTEDVAEKIERLRVFARPWPVVKRFREAMERDLRPDPVPDPIWELPGDASLK